MSTKPGMISEVMAFIRQYATFPSEDYALASALWAVGTYFWRTLDVFPYLVITSDTKRSGKSRLKELLMMVAKNPQNMSAMTAATVYRVIGQREPTLFVDEAESLNSEAASTVRVVLNVGYRADETIPRVVNGEVVDFSAYCPKCFVLIGDVYDTLRDRSIIVRMKRGEPFREFVLGEAKEEGSKLRERLLVVAGGVMSAVSEAYRKYPSLKYLTNRDAEIWKPLMAIASVVEPHLLKRLARIATDLSTEKTTSARKFTALKDAEEQVEDEEYAVKLLRDMITVCDGQKSIWTREAIDKLWALDTAPWRKYRGTGLSDIELGTVLGERFGVRPRTVRKGKATAKGYAKAELVAAREKNGL